MKPLFLFLLCGNPAWTGVNPYATVGAIPLPVGYHRVSEDAGSFAMWLRGVALKKNLTVFLYNGVPKQNQDAQFAVLNITVGHEDLQQCADAVMRLRALAGHSYREESRRQPEPLVPGGSHGRAGGNTRIRVQNQ